MTAGFNRGCIMKKILPVMAILLVFGMIIFFAGWIQFFIPVGNYGVLVSKTGGVNPNPVLPGQFRWHWERLLPTNTQILTFTPHPVRKTIKLEDELPSSIIYRSLLEGNPSFSWKFEIEVTGIIVPERLISLVRDLKIHTQDELDQWVDTRMVSIVSDTVSTFIGNVLTRPESTNSDLMMNTQVMEAEIKKILGEVSHSDIDILQINVITATIPDFDLYQLAKKTYAAYQQERSVRYIALATEEGSLAAQEYLQIERFSKWGEILQKYPVLIDFLAVARDDAGEAFKAVRSLR